MSPAIHVLPFTFVLTMLSTGFSITSDFRKDKARRASSIDEVFVAHFLTQCGVLALHSAWMVVALRNVFSSAVGNFAGPVFLMFYLEGLKGIALGLSIPFINRNVSYPFSMTALLAEFVFEMAIIWNGEWNMK